MTSRKARTPKGAAGVGAAAPGQFYGYSIQITRALAHLLRCHDGQAVSVECLDDVAVTGADGNTLEQVKSGLAHNPLSDHAVDLWKTLHAWVEAIRAGALSSDMRFVLFTAQPWHGSLVTSLHEANSREQALGIINGVRKEFWGNGPRFSKKKNLADALAPHVNGVLQASDDVLVRLILNFSLETGSGSPNDDLRPQLCLAISDAAVENVLQYLLGWAKRQIDKLIEQGQPATLTWAEFRKQLVAAAKKFDRNETVLCATQADITPADVDSELRNRIYVRQLHLLNAADVSLVRAVNDFLRAATDRTTWSERGDVLEPSFAEFEDRLQRAWESQRKLVPIELPGRAEEQHGQALLERCTQLQVRLQGMDVPSHFVPGSFHSLAEVLAVGWHPRFEELLSARTVAFDAGTGKDGAQNVTGGGAA